MYIWDLEVVCSDSSGTLSFFADSVDPKAVFRFPFPGDHLCRLLVEGELEPEAKRLEDAALGFCVMDLCFMQRVL